MTAVTLTVVYDEAEAEIVCGMLRANGIECGHRRSGMATAAWAGGFETGGIEVLVGEDDLPAAQALLPDDEPVAGSTDDPG